VSNPLRFRVILHAAYQDRDQFTVLVELPGLKKEDIDISLQDATLTITGERRQERTSSEGYRNERSHCTDPCTTSLGK